MGVRPDSTFIYRLTWMALAVSLLSLILIVAVVQAGGDTSTALWLILLLLLLFVSIPLHGLLLVTSLLRLIKGNARSLRWVFLYLAITVIGHALVAGKLGAFQGVSDNVSQLGRQLNTPAQVKLEKALLRGPVSNIDEVRLALSSGADPNGSVFDGRMPLLVLVASRADAQAIETLLDAGADPNRRSSIDHAVRGATVENASALDIVLFSERNDIAGSVRQLLAAGAELATTNLQDQYPLDVAIANEQFEAALLIAMAGGKANKKGSVEFVLENSAQNAHLEELGKINFY